MAIWAKEMADKRGLSKFAASCGCLSNFVKKFHLSIRR